MAEGIRVVEGHLGSQIAFVVKLIGMILFGEKGRCLGTGKYSF